MPRAFSVFHCTRQYRVTRAQVFNGIQQTALYPLQNKMERVLQLGRAIERQRRFRPSSTPAFAGLLCDGSLFLVLASDVDIRWSLVSACFDASSRPMVMAAFRPRSRRCALLTTHSMHRLELETLLRSRFSFCLHRDSWRPSQR